MKRARNALTEVLGWCGVFILVAVGLPLLALTVLVARVLAVAVLAAGLAGVIVLYCAHPPFRRWIDRQMRGAPASDAIVAPVGVPGHD